ncbi:MAG: hopanoid biosynthesis associated radical SAM protein HpnJ [Verrucomicrobiota bacterium]
MSALFLRPPSFTGPDAGAVPAHPARPEDSGSWYPTWLAQAAALVPGARLLDCPPHGLGIDQALGIAAGYDHVILHTSTPTLRHDCRVADAIKARRPRTRIGFVGAHAAVLPTGTLRASPAIDWVGRREFDFTCREVCEGRPMEQVAGLSFRQEGRIIHNPERELLPDLDPLPWVADVYRRDLVMERYQLGYLLHPYLGLSTGRGCPARCTFCLWPQTLGGHQYRVRSAANVAAEVAYLRRLFPQVREFFFDDDTFTADLPRAREIARRLAPLGIPWSCHSRANLDEDTLRQLRAGGLRLLVVGYESGDEEMLRRIRKGIGLAEMRRFTRACQRAGVAVHGTFILWLPGETPETLERTLQFALELEVSSIQVSLAAPYPGTHLHEQARQQDGFARPDPVDRPRDQAPPPPAPAYPGLGRDRLLEEVDRFHRAYFLRPGPLLRTVRTMLEDKRTFVRRCREGVEFLRGPGERRPKRAAARPALA